MVLDEDDAPELQRRNRCLPLFRPLWPFHTSLLPGISAEPMSIEPLGQEEYPFGEMLAEPVSDFFRTLFASWIRNGCPLE
jgi:hypothetical protein